MFGKTSPQKVHSNRWYVDTLNKYCVTDLFNGIDYGFNALFAKLEGKELTLWFEGAYLTTLPISKSEANLLFETHKLNRCDTPVPLHISDIFKSRNGTEFFFVGKDLCTKEHAFSAVELTLVDSEAKLNIIANDKTIAVFESEVEIEIFREAHTQALSIADTSMDNKSLENSKTIDKFRAEERKQAEEETRKKNRDIELRENGYNHIILTTESISPFAVRKRLGIITAEYVYRTTVLSSIAAGLSGIGETRHSFTQNALKEARASVLAELRREAHNLGADAVVAVDLDYSEVAGAGSPMMFLVASGTAIEIDK